jgi:DNA-directed RNA polymerase subunit RPC12/RpoP
VPISVTCEQCGRAFRFADDKAGRQFHCKQCGSLVLIPAASMPADPPPDDADDDEYGNPVPPRLIRPAGKRDDGTAASPRSRDVPEKPPRQKFGGLTIWGWVILICSIGCVGVVALCVGVVVLLRNESPPVLDGPNVRPMVDQAMTELQTKNAALQALIHFEDTKWLLDQEQGTISFDSKKIHAVAPVQIIGTYNTADGSWLWAWDNPSLVKGLTRDSQVVREYGQKHGIAPLTTRKLNCDEADCWELTALACQLCKAEGAYRGPGGKTLVFMTFGKLTMSKPGAK